MNRSVIAAVIGCAGLASTALGQGVSAIGSWHAETRWIVTGLDGGATCDANGTYIPTPGSSLAIPVTGATAILLTLQSRTVFDTTITTSGTTSARRGNFNVYTLGFGPGSVPATITRTGVGAAATTLYRGDWGIDSEGNEVDGDGNALLLRGAAPGEAGPNTDNTDAVANFDSPSLRGMRFWTAADPAGNDASGNLGVSDAFMPNGAFDASGNLTNLNLLRTAYNRTASPNNATAPGHAVWETPVQSGLAAARRGNRGDGTDASVDWMDMYRVLITSPIALVPGTGLDVTFNGWIRTSTQENLANGTMLLSNDTTTLAVQQTATISFGQVPTPGAAALMGLGGLMVARRRR